MDIIGNGRLLAKHAQMTVTGNSGNISTIDFEVVNKINFPNLIFTPESDSLMSFDEDTGIYTLLDLGIMQIDCSLNVQASQASAEFHLIPEFNYGSGWERGCPRKKILTAIKPGQISFHGSKFFPKDTMFRFWVKAVSGNIIFKTETIDPGGPLEVILPAAVYYLALDKLTVPAGE